MGGIKKEFQKLDNSPDSLTVLGSSVSAFARVPSVEKIVIAVNENTQDAARNALPPQYRTCEKPKIVFVNGGPTRRASVYNALRFLADYNPGYVLIHDGARPRVKPSLIENIIEATKKYGAVIPLLPLTDTPKECEKSFESDVSGVFIKKHIKRANTGIAQTPQGFKFPEVLNAHTRAEEAEGEEFTDDAEIWGQFCGKVAVIPGDPENKKITYPEDL
jgi:2-C-methyl-D-erythritol 4-phosphate cytidylyltransferase/2-C-methyl-D-erythritol 4-phosphate cytidylyltransferase/2-C-methyl-D-erythritol 2,4-cyclodiphosphate synthase